MGWGSRSLGVTDAGSPQVAPKAIGILGGTFDPVHLGHLALASEAFTGLDLAGVCFVPNGDPPHKQGQRVTAAVHREAMVALAIAERAEFELDRTELLRDGPSYAVDTVAEFAARSLAEGRPEPWFVLASEVLDGFPDWREPERILDLCRIAVAPRVGAPPLGQDWVTRHYPGRQERFAFLPGPHLDVAATQIRERMARGEPIAALVPGPVLDYIEAQGLYRQEATERA